MSIQILELIIKVTVEDERLRSTSANLNSRDTFHQQELVSECVEQTLKRLEQLKER